MNDNFGFFNGHNGLFMFTRVEEPSASMCLYVYKYLKLTLNIHKIYIYINDLENTWKLVFSCETNISCTYMSRVTQFSEKDFFSIFLRKLKYKCCEQKLTQIKSSGMAGDHFQLNKKIIRKN